jgi:uncharacterized protein YjbJ (UPF0337 family)
MNKEQINGGAKEAAGKTEKAVGDMKETAKDARKDADREADKRGA